MGLEEILMPVTKVFTGIKSKAYRWSSESLVDKVKNTWHNTKYYARNAYEVIKTPLKWFEEAVQYAIESRVVGALPAAWTNRYVSKLGIRWKNRPTVLSAMQGLVFDNPFQIATGLAMLGTPFASFGWFQLVNGIYGMGESAFRLGYALKTGKNMGIATYAVPAKVGTWVYKKFKGRHIAAPLYKRYSSYRDSLTGLSSYSPARAYALG